MEILDEGEDVKNASISFRYEVQGSQQSTRRDILIDPATLYNIIRTWVAQPAPIDQCGKKQYMMNANVEDYDWTGLAYPAALDGAPIVGATCDF
jgi:hypothetical protein